MAMRRLFAAFCLCVAAVSCATQLPAPVSTFDNIQLVRRSNIAPLALGAFGPGPNLSSAADRGVSFRADTLRPPNGSTFSEFLRQTIEAELAGAGKLDQNARYVLSAQLTRSEASTFGAESRALLAAQFQLSVDGAVAFDKEIVVENAWPSAFMGATAIPDAENHYTELYARVFAALLADAEFQAAAR